MYKAIIKFADGQDANRVYEVNDIYPVEGVEVSEERLKYLQDIGVIEKAVEKKPAKAVKKDATDK